MGKGKGLRINKELTETWGRGIRAVSMVEASRGCEPENQR
jgi:hypothetical protein